MVNCSDHGTCVINNSSKLVCECQSDFTDSKCSVSLRPCAYTSCLNGGTCVDLSYANGTFYVHFADRAAFLVALHEWFHDTVFAQVIDRTADQAPGPDRARMRIIAFLDACRAMPGVRALLLDARTEPAIAVEVDRHNRQATQTLSVDLRGTTRRPAETARIMVLAAADIAGRESTCGRRLPTARQALLDLMPGSSDDVRI